MFAAEACGIAGWAVQTAADYARIRHQFGRPIGQFQAVKHRCARMLTAAEQAAAASWDAVAAHDAPDDAARGTGRRMSSPRAVAAVVALDARGQLRARVHPGSRRDRLHLGTRRPTSTTGGPVAARAARPVARWARRVAELALDGTRRPVRVDLPADAEPLRTRIRADLAAVAGAEPPARTASGWPPVAGSVPHLPAPWGRAAGPLEQLVIAEEDEAGRAAGPGLLIGAWVVPALVQLRHPGAAGAFPARHPARRDHLVPAVQRARRRLGPGRADDPGRAETGDGEGGGGWRLTGQKVWTSLAREADWAICVARTDPSSRRHAGITYFLVNMTSPGSSVRPLREMTGDAVFNEVFLDGVEVPDDLVVGDVGGGWQVARTTLANERVSLSRNWTFGCGVPELLDVLRGLGEPDRQAWPSRPGNWSAEGHALDVLGMRVTLKQLSGTEPGRPAACASCSACAMRSRSRSCAGRAGSGGARAGSRQHHWARQVLLTRALTIGGGTTDIQLNIIGERMLGLPRDPEPPADNLTDKAI